MTTDEYEQFDAVGLAALVRSRQVTPAELMRCAIELAEARAPALNALCYERFEESLSLASTHEPRGLFQGIPFLLKDSALASRRFPSSIGSRLFKDLTFRFDATLTSRFEAAGLIPFARTTVPELCMAPTTEAVQNRGPTRNPWNLERSAGGSSGGSAVAVAAGIVPMAHGNDGGGSIRIPASCCGLYGLKPSRGLTPMGPARGEGWGGLATEGVLSRSVRDTAAALDAVAGDEAGAPYAAPQVPASYLDLLNRPLPRSFRVMHWQIAWEDLVIDAECREATVKAATLLRSAGHEVIETPPPDLDYSAFIEALVLVLCANIVSSVHGIVAGKPVSEWQGRLEPAILDGYHIGRSLTAEQYVQAINTFHSVGRRIARHMAGYDFALTPALMSPPVMLNTITMNSDFRLFRRRVANYTTFLAITNASGQPSATLPLHQSADGLPIGIQLIGRFGGEGDLLRLSSQLEQASPWAARRPLAAPIALT